VLKVEAEPVLRAESAEFARENCDQDANSTGTSNARANTSSLVRPRPPRFVALSAGSSTQIEPEDLQHMWTALDGPTAFFDYCLKVYTPSVQGSTMRGKYGSSGARGSSLRAPAESATTPSSLCLTSGAILALLQTVEPMNQFDLQQRLLRARNPSLAYPLVYAHSKSQAPTSGQRSQPSA